MTTKASKEKFQTAVAPLIGLVPLSPFIQRHRTTHIIRRARLLSAVLAVLFLAWIIVDWIVFDWPLSGYLAGMRGGVGLAFIALARSKEAEKSVLFAVFMVAVLVLLPTLLFLGSAPLFVNAQLTEFGHVVAALYPLLPVMMVATLAIFPLTLRESGVLGVLALAAYAFGIFPAAGLDWVTFASQIWLATLILLTSSFACMMQLRYMTTLVRQASFDPLTGAFTRDSGAEMIDVQFHVAERQDGPFSIAFLDLDNFKLINDNYGHDEGDRILYQMVNELETKKRDSDVVVRWGGEEFLLVLPNTDLKGVRQALTRIMSGWFGERPDGAPLTASIGVAERRSDHEYDWHHLVELADHRMYEAKQDGRSRAVLPNDETMLTETASPKD